MPRIEASYSKSAGADGVTIKVVPATSPDAGFSFARLFLSAIPAYAAVAIVMAVGGQTLFVALSFLGEGFIGLLSIVGAVVGAVAFLFAWFVCYRWFSRWLLRKQAEGRHAYEVEMLVNGSGIAVAGAGMKQFLRREDLHRLVIKNAFDDSCDIPMSGYVAAGSPMAVGVGVAANAMTNSVAALANHKRRAAARISYIVTVEAGGVSHKLAGGLTEVCAHGLMTDIDRALHN